MATRLTLDMWQAFIAIAEKGSTNKAAEHLSKSQSAVAQSLKKAEAQLGNALFRVEGRQSVLTKLGEELLPRAQRLVSEAQAIERSASHHAGEVMHELSIGADILLNKKPLLEAIDRFHYLHPNTSVRLIDTALSGVLTLMKKGKISLGIAGQFPPDCVQEPLLLIEMVCVASPDLVPLCQPALSIDTLHQYRQIVLADSGEDDRNSGWLGARKRLTVSTVATAIDAVIQQHGFAWLPRHSIQTYIQSGTLIEIDLSKGAQRNVPLALGFPTELSHISEIKDLTELILATMQT